MDLSFASALSSFVFLVSDTEATWVLSSVLWPAARLQRLAKKDPRTFVDCIAPTEEVVSKPHGSQGMLRGRSLACPHHLPPGTPEGGRGGQLIRLVLVSEWLLLAQLGDDVRVAQGRFMGTGWGPISHR